MFVRMKTFTQEENKSSSEGTFFPKKCCCIMISVYTLNFLVMFHLKRNKRRYDK